MKNRWKLFVIWLKRVFLPFAKEQTKLIWKLEKAQIKKIIYEKKHGIIITQGGNK